VHFALAIRPSAKTIPPWPAFGLGWLQPRLTRVRAVVGRPAFGVQTASWILPFLASPCRRLRHHLDPRHFPAFAHFAGVGHPLQGFIGFFAIGFGPFTSHRVAGQLDCAPEQPLRFLPSDGRHHEPKSGAMQHIRYRDQSRRNRSAGSDSRPALESASALSFAEFNSF
jgi:hypothetical protein